MFLTFGFILVPLVMIIYGIISYEEEPRFDKMLGYRTKRSLKNSETFVYANRKISQYFIRFNCVSLIITISYCVIYQCYYMYFSDFVEVSFLMSLCFIQIICCFGPYYIVEKKLQKKFIDNINYINVGMFEDDIDDDFFIDQFDVSFDGFYED